MPSLHGVDGAGTGGACYDSLTGAVYTANSFGDNVSVIDGATNVRRFNVDVGIYPNLLPAARPYGKVFCGNQNSSSISVISDSLLGIAATPNDERRATNGNPTIVRGVLFLPASGALLDLSRPQGAGPRARRQ